MYLNDVKFWSCSNLHFLSDKFSWISYWLLNFEIYLFFFKHLFILLYSYILCSHISPMLIYILISDNVSSLTDIPQVSLRLIKEEADRPPKEDDFVRLVCDADSNPPLLKVGWLFNSLPLSHNESATDVVSGNTLVFKRLTRRNKGHYKCYAINEEGRGVSQELMLNISRKYCIKLYIDSDRNNRQPSPKSAFILHNILDALDNTFSNWFLVV